MKKSIIYSIAIILGIIVLQACNQKDSQKEKKSEATEETVHADYQCPEGHENGKTYHEPGKCPVCGMELVKDEHHDGEHHDGEVHVDGHDSHEKDSAKHDDKEGHHEGDGHKH